MASRSFADYVALLKATLSAVDLTPFWESDQYQRGTQQGEMVFPYLREAAQPLLAIVRGESDRIREDLPTMQSLNLANRVFKKPATSYLSGELRSSVERSIEDTFLLGVVLHLIFMTFPTRLRLSEIDLTGVLERSGHEALVADRFGRTYSESLQAIPEACFKLYHAHTIEPEFKQWRLGILRRGKADSHFRNLFFAGAWFALTCDLETRA